MIKSIDNENNDFYTVSEGRGNSKTILRKATYLY